MSDWINNVCVIGGIVCGVMTVMISGDVVFNKAIKPMAADAKKERTEINARIKACEKSGGIPILTGWSRELENCIFPPQSTK